MIHRFKQFFSALGARLTPEDFVLVKALLNSAEQNLFMAMHVIDQKHSIDVLKTCVMLVSKETTQINHSLLYKAALLHDVGKRRGQLSIPDRVLVVLLKTFLPGLFYRLAERQNSFCYISKNHPFLGAQFCLNVGCQDELIQLVKLHQQGGPGKELEILRIADRQN